MAHELLGTQVVGWLAMLQLVSAVLLWRPGRGPGWAPLLAVAVFVAVVLQIGWGYHGVLALHVPNALLILTFQLVLLLRLPAHDRRSERIGA